MSGFPLHDWNDVRLLLACVQHGSFAGAATSLGVDQATVSRRIGLLEEKVGRPLFHRRRSGAAPTPAGVVLMERAMAVFAAIGEFEATLSGLEMMPAAMVTLGASDGILSYILIPALVGNPTTNLPVDGGLIRHALPPLAFTSTPRQGDISIIATATEDIPAVGGAMRVRRVGTMHFKPVVGRAFLESGPLSATNFDDLASLTLLDMPLYQPLKSLSGWNALVSNSSSENVIVTPNTKTMHKMIVDGRGVGILPSYSHLYDDRIISLDLPSPSLSISLWLVAHEDKLREPSVRMLYDTLAEMFLRSPWFR